MSRRHPSANPPYVQPEPGPDGRPRCRWCWSAVPKGKRSWCGMECVDEYYLHTDWSVIRAFVFKRDQGICAICGHDSAKLVRIMQAARKLAKRLHCYDYAAHTATLRELGGLPHLFDQWQADHIRAKHLGGEDHPRNLRTLCITCHAGVTTGQAAARARSRRDERAALFGGAR